MTGDVREGWCCVEFSAGQNSGHIGQRILRQMSEGLVRDLEVERGMKDNTQVVDFRG